MVIGQLIRLTVKICIQQVGRLEELVWLVTIWCDTEYLACGKPQRRAGLSAAKRQRRLFFSVPRRVKGWVDLGTAVRVCSPCPRLYMDISIFILHLKSINNEILHIMSKCFLRSFDYGLNCQSRLAPLSNPAYASAHSCSVVNAERVLTIISTWNSAVNVSWNRHLRFQRTLDVSVPRKIIDTYSISCGFWTTL